MNEKLTGIIRNNAKYWFSAITLGEFVQKKLRYNTKQNKKPAMVTPIGNHLIQDFFVLFKIKNWIIQKIIPIPPKYKKNINPPKIIFNTII